MADTLSQVVIAEGYPAFFASDAPHAITALHSARADPTNIRPRLWFGNTNRRAPRPAREFRQPSVAHGRIAVSLQEPRRAARIDWQHAECGTGRVEYFLHCNAQREREALPAGLFGRGQAEPTGLGKCAPRFAMTICG